MQQETMKYEKWNYPLAHRNPIESHTRIAILGG